MSGRYGDGLEFFNFAAQFAERDVLDLANAFASDAELFADFLEGLLAAAIEAEAITQDGHLSGVKDADHLAHEVGIGFVLEFLIRVGGAFVGDDVGDATRVVIAQGSIEGSRADGGSLELAHLFGWNVEFLPDLLRGGLPPEFLFEARGGATDMQELIGGVDRDAHGFGLIGQGASDGWFDPPIRESR